MVATHPMSEGDYSRLVFATRGWHLELRDGVVREKPGATWDHGNVKTELMRLFMDQLDHNEFLVSVMLRVRQPPSTILVPDLMIVPDAYGEGFRDRPDVLAIFDDPMPLVVEIWTAIDGYDVDAKIPIYMQRGDQEIWRIHPYEKTLTAWRRQPDGTYDQSLFKGAEIICPVALPDVNVDLAALFV